MKFLFSINILFALLLGCSTKQSGKDIEYIKILTEGLSDTITSYNKGLGLSSYLYYEPKNDSVVLRSIEAVEPHRYKTHVGKFSNEHYLDTLLRLLKKLRQHPDGFLPDTTPIGSVNYCGPAFYVVYKDSKGIHNYGFTLVDGNDTLDQFYNFYSNLLDLQWENKIVDNFIINADYEIVEATKKVGIYQQIEEPYIPSTCGAGIDFNKIYGRWRKVGNDLHNEKRSTYYKLIMNKDGTSFNGKIEKDLQTADNSSARFVLNKTDTTITFKRGKDKYTYKISKLTDRCFDFYYTPKAEKRFVRYDRM